MPFLTSVVSLTNPSGSDTLGTAGVLHATQHANANDEIEKIEQYLLTSGIPACRVYNNADETISNATETTITFNTERYDTDTMHSTVTNTGRITATVAGTYRFTACIRWQTNGTGTRETLLRLNGTTYIGGTGGPASGSSRSIQTVSAEYVLAAGDYVEVRVLQASTISLAVVAEANISPEFSAVRVG